MKLSNDWIEFISGWRRNFAPDELPAFIKQLKCIRNNEIAQLEAKNARLKKELLAHKENEGDECPLCACEAKNDRLKRENERLKASVSFRGSPHSQRDANKGARR